MTTFRPEQYCDGCGVEITWAPVMVAPVQGQAGIRPGEYCCQDCADGLRCRCRERALLDDERRKQPLDL